MDNLRLDAHLDNDGIGQYYEVSQTDRAARVRGILALMCPGRKSWCKPKKL